MSDKLEIIGGNNYTASLRITPRIDIANQTLAFDMVEKILDWPKRYTTEAVSLKEKAIREGLIALGWTPPKEAGE